MTSHCTYQILFIRLSVDGPGVVYILVIVNNAALNTAVQVSIWVPAFSSLRAIPRSWLAGSYGDSRFNFLEGTTTVVHSGYILRSCCSAPGLHFLHILVSTCYFQDSFCFLIIAVFLGTEWCVIVLLICIFLVTGHVKHLFLCLLGICISSLEKGLLKYFAPLKSSSGCFCCWVMVVLFIFWNLSLTRCALQIFSPILCVVFDNC